MFGNQGGLGWRRGQMATGRMVDIKGRPNEGLQNLRCTQMSDMPPGTMMVFVVVVTPLFLTKTTERD